MFNYRKQIILLSFLFIFIACSRKKEVIIFNKSFEGKAEFFRMNFYLDDWFDCGYIEFPNEHSSPDIHLNGLFEVNTLPSSGKTYVGMVVRDNSTWESIGQALTYPIRKDVCYSFTIDLCRSKKYESQSRVTKLPLNYAEPIVLRVWGGNYQCAKAELLVESPLI